MREQPREWRSDRLHEIYDVGEAEDDTDRHGYREQFTDVAVLGEEPTEDALIPRSVSDLAQRSPPQTKSRDHAL